MADYLQPVGDATRRIAAFACLLAALVAAPVTLLIVIDMVRRGDFYYDGKPLWVGAVVCGLIATASGWMAVRLWTDRSANGVTILPVWFIEVFGVLFLTGTIWVGVERGGLWDGSVAIGIGVGVAMLLIRRAVRHRAPEAMAPTGSPGPRFHLILMNDNMHSYEYVIDLLRQEFGLPFGKALALTRAIDANGRGVVFTGTRAEVDLKLERVLAAGPAPALPTSTGPLRVLVEDAEGSDHGRAEPLSYPTDLNKNEDSGSA
jgi:ATP-dependent Clp protease adaptor protein ClpS